MFPSRPIAQWQSRGATINSPVTGSPPSAPNVRFESSLLNSSETRRNLTELEASPMSPLKFSLQPSSRDAHDSMNAFDPVLISPAAARAVDPVALRADHKIRIHLPPLPQMDRYVKAHERPCDSAPIVSYKQQFASFTPLREQYRWDLAPPQTKSQSLILPPSNIHPITEQKDAALTLLQLGTPRVASASGTVTGRDVQPSPMAGFECRVRTGPAAVAEKSCSKERRNPSSTRRNPEEATESSSRAVTPTPTTRVRLALPEDALELNRLHCFVRSELLELFETPEGSLQGKQTTRRRTTSGRVGLRCVYCAHLPRRERAGATMAAFYPRNIADIYRSVCTWQRIHFRACRHIPPNIRATYWRLKETDRSRGKTRYWVSSAGEVGLVDIGVEKGGICFACQH